MQSAGYPTTRRARDKPLHIAAYKAVCARQAFAHCAASKREHGIPALVGLGNTLSRLVRQVR